MDDDKSMQLAMHNLSQIYKCYRHELDIVTHPSQQSETSRTTATSFQSKCWTAEENEMFLDGVELYGRGKAGQIAGYLKTRSVQQVVSHSQKYFQKLLRVVDENEVRFAISDDIAQYLQELALRFVNKTGSEYTSVIFEPTHNQNQFYADAHYLALIHFDRKKLARVFATVLWYCGRKGVALEYAADKMGLGVEVAAMLLLAEGMKKM